MVTVLSNIASRIVLVRFVWMPYKYVRSLGRNTGNRVRMYNEAMSSWKLSKSYLSYLWEGKVLPCSDKHVRTEKTIKPRQWGLHTNHTIFRARFLPNKALIKSLVNNKLNNNFGLCPVWTVFELWGGWGDIWQQAKLLRENWQSSNDSLQILPWYLISRNKEFGENLSQDDRSEQNYSIFPVVIRKVT